MFEALKGYSEFSGLEKKLNNIISKLDYIEKKLKKSKDSTNLNEIEDKYSKELKDIINSTMKKSELIFAEKANLTDIYFYLKKIRNWDINQILNKERSDFIYDIVKSTGPIFNIINENDNLISGNIIKIVNKCKMCSHIIFFDHYTYSYFIVFNNQLAKFNNIYFEKIENIYSKLIELTKPKLTYTLASRLKRLSSYFPVELPQDILKIINEFWGINPSDKEAFKQFFEYLNTFKKDHFNHRLYTFDIAHKMHSILKTIYYQETNLIPPMISSLSKNISPFFNVFCTSYLTNLPMIPEYLKYFRQRYNCKIDYPLIKAFDEFQTIDDFIDFRYAGMSHFGYSQLKKQDFGFLIDDKLDDFIEWVQILQNKIETIVRIKNLYPAQIDVLIIPQSIYDVLDMKYENLYRQRRIFNQRRYLYELYRFKIFHKYIQKNNNDIQILAKYTNTHLTKKESLDRLMSKLELKKNKRYIFIFDRSEKYLEIKKIGTYHENSPSKEILYIIQPKKKWNEVNYEKFLISFSVNSNKFWMPWGTIQKDTIVKNSPFSFVLSFHIIDKNYISPHFCWFHHQIKFNKDIINEIWKKIFVPQKTSKQFHNYKEDEEFNIFVNSMINFYKEKLHFTIEYNKQLVLHRNINSFNLLSIKKYNKRYLIPVITTLTEDYLKQKKELEEINLDLEKLLKSFRFFEQKIKK